MGKSSPVRWAFVFAGFPGWPRFGELFLKGFYAPVQAGHILLLLEKLEVEAGQRLILLGQQGFQSDDAFFHAADCTTFRT